jgi:hypothetical protein
MALKSMGILSPEAIEALKKEKLLMLNRGGEVWVEECDISRVTEVLKKVKNPVDQVYRFHGCLIKMPKDIVLEQKWYGGPSNPVGRLGKIHIHEMAKPSNGLDHSDRVKTIASIKIKKEEIRLQANTYTPGYAGIVMCDDDGIPMFEVTAFNIWVLFDPRSNPESTRKIYDHMLMFAIVLANHTDDKSVRVWSEIWATQAPERERLEIKQFEEMVTGSIRRELAALEKTIAQRERSVKEFQQRLYTESKALSEDSIRLDVFKVGMSGGIEKKAREEWEKIKNLEKHGAVKNVRITAEQMCFQTREIKFTPPKFPVTYKNQHSPEKTVSCTAPVRIGAFEITVHLGQNFEIEITNITRMLDYDGIKWHHPHIRESGICKGNMSEALPGFAAKRDFEAIIMCILRWLENVDVNDTWGRGIYHWVVEDNRCREEEEAEKKRKEQEAKQKEAEAAKVGQAALAAPEAVSAPKGNGDGAGPGAVPAVAVAPVKGIADTVNHARI